MSREAKRAKWALAALVMYVVPGVANADSSCDRLFNGLRNAPVVTGALTDVRALWATNYFIAERDARFTGTTQIVLGLQNGDLFGTGTRTQTVYSADPAERPFKRTDAVSLRIRRDGRIMLNDQYGPFDPTCWHDKYVVVRSGDSVEVFTLYRTNPVTVTIMGGEPERPSYLTLFEHDNFTGRSHTLPVQPQPLEHGIRVPSNALRQANLFGRVSSARLECGTRPSRATLFDIDWSKDSKGIMIECNPGQTASVDLAAKGLNDKINAAAVIAHVRSSDSLPHNLGFSFLFAQAWKEELKSISAATPTHTSIWLENFNSFIITQSLTLDHWACEERAAHFTMRVTVSANALKPSFRVETLSQYVAEGLGDAWGCRSDMVNELRAKLEPARSKLEANLPQILAVAGNPSSPTFYFAPSGDVDIFDLFFAK